MSTHRENLVEFYSGEVAQRKARPISANRLTGLRAFLDVCEAEGLTSVLEVGAGVGRDGVVLAERLRYSGVDITPAFVTECRAQGLDVVLASADSLPHDADSVDAAWSMSTLMHLTDAEFGRAIAELGRVVRPGGLIEIGMWGHDPDREITGSGGRYFRQRSDDTVRTAVQPLGDLRLFDTWDYSDFGHYQYLRVRRR